jgi:hypothetical protein
MEERCFKTLFLQINDMSLGLQPKSLSVLIPYDCIKSITLQGIYTPAVPSQAVRCFSFYDMSGQYYFQNLQVGGTPPLSMGTNVPIPLNTQLNIPLMTSRDAEIKIPAVLTVKQQHLDGTAPEDSRAIIILVLELAKWQ